jgi:hypothetical protein
MDQRPTKYDAHLEAQPALNGDLRWRLSDAPESFVRRPAPRDLGEFMRPPAIGPKPWAA